MADHTHQSLLNGAAQFRRRDVLEDKFLFRPAVMMRHSRRQNGYIAGGAGHCLLPGLNLTFAGDGIDHQPISAARWPVYGVIIRYAEMSSYQKSAGAVEIPESYPGAYKDTLGIESWE